MILYSCTIGLLLALDVLLDWYLSQKKLFEIHHGTDALVFALIYVSVLGNIWQYQNDPFTTYLAALLWVLPIRWIVHDYFLNKISRKKWDYLGDGFNDAATDKLLKALPIHQLWVKGIFLLAISLLNFTVLL